MAISSGGANQPAGSGGSSSPTGSGGIPGGGSQGGSGGGGNATTGGVPGTGGLTGSGGSIAAAGGATGSGGSIASTGGVTGSGGRVAGSGGSSGASGSGASGSGAGGNIVDAGTDAARPVDAGVGTDANQAALPAITLHLAGDSTVMTYTTPTATADEGWGQELGQFFISKVTINNQAIGGASVQSFYTSSRWQNILSGTKPGDYVMAQFGANDSGSVEGRHVEVPAFQMFFGQMADEVKAKQGTLIPVTPSALQEWSGGRQGNARVGPYAATLIALGPMKNVLVDDLNARSVEYLNTIGQTAAMQIYKAGDKAHFTKMGATVMARFVAEELRRIGSPLAAYLK